MDKLFQLFLPTIILILALCSTTITHADIDAGFVGAMHCASCHQQQYDDWQGSHHEQAMMHANAQSVLGDFDNSSFDYNGIRSTFFKKGEDFWVNTDGANGQLQDFKIAYTFGVEPLQQYLVGFDDGRYQALSIAWDARPKSAGGQRWFHLYPEEEVDSDDVLHWTRYANNWNSRCAECHSTNLNKNYQPSSNSFNTTWSDINVACESCHGPGGEHIDWAANDTADVTSAVGNKGLRRKLAVHNHWQRLPGMATASIDYLEENNREQVNRCAACHSRRGTINTHTHNQALSAQLLDSHLPSLITMPLYFADGQIRDEVYVYGSFMQSKMQQQGVTCSNCHNPHSLKLKTEGNQLCAQCHNPSQFDSPKHHHHAQNSAGAQCVDCHMPQTTYMVVDPRRDHSLRIPQPQLSQQLGVPNACNQCHVDRSVDWALKAFERWYPDWQERSVGPLFAAANNGQAQAMPQLAALSNDVTQPLMVRASAVEMLASYNHQYAINSAITQLQSLEPLIRLGALQALDNMSLQQRMQHLWPLLQDPVLAVRLAATRLLAGVALPDQGEALLDPKRQQLLNKAVADYIAAMQESADMPAGQMQLGLMYLARKQFDQAENAYRQALLIEPSFIPALMNLADLYRQQGRDRQAKPLLEKALAIDAQNADSQYAMGLLYIRLGQTAAAVEHLAAAAQAAPQVALYSYVYAVSLFETGKHEWAIATLKQSLKKHPGDRNILSALAAYLNKLGRVEEAKRYAAQL